MTVPVPFDHPAVDGILQQGPDHKLNPDLVLGEIHELSLARPPPMLKGGRGRDHAITHPHMIHIRPIEDAGSPVRISRHVRKPAEGREVRAEPRVKGMGTGLALIAAAQENDIRIHFLHVFISESQFFHGPRGEILNDDIRPGDELLGEFHAPFGFEVNRHSVLVVVADRKGSGTVQSGLVVFVGRIILPESVRPFVGLHMDRGRAVVCHMFSDQGSCCNRSKFCYFYHLQKSDASSVSLPVRPTLAI